MDRYNPTGEASSTNCEEFNSEDDGASVPCTNWRNVGENPPAGGRELTTEVSDKVVDAFKNKWSADLKIDDEVRRRHLPSTSRAHAFFRFRMTSRDI